MFNTDFRSLFAEEPERMRVSGLGADGDGLRIKPKTFEEDVADPRFSRLPKGLETGERSDDAFW